MSDGPSTGPFNLMSRPVTATRLGRTKAALRDLAVREAFALPQAVDSHSLVYRSEAEQGQALGACYLSLSRR